MLRRKTIMKNKHGFTLIELLSVVIILSILTAIAVPQYTKSIQRTEAANALISLKTTYDSAKRYNSSFGSWPTSFKGLDVKVLLNTNSDGSALDASSPWYNTSGAYQYSFPNHAVQACRIREGESGAPEQLYCLRATYSSSGSTADTYTCQATIARYQNLCASLCNTETATASCTIKN